MFPYTSGQAHVGHVRNYTIGDVISRYQFMQGKTVLQPFGWDSFGLPAENAAIKNKSHPATWTQKNIASMKGQIKRLGYAYDWDREFATCDPEYYRWQQWLFIQMFKNDMVYQKEAWVNWDPVDQTVLANEQVINGRGWRSDALVERKKILQWFCKITEFSDDLLSDLQSLPLWPEQVKRMQENWIGKSEGASILFDIEDQDQPLEVFTTRADTLYGATFLALSPEHPLSRHYAQTQPEIQAFIDACRVQSTAEADLATAEKQGIFTGKYGIHPLTGKKVALWIANYILMDYGTGAIMAVPAHDERDLAFAEKYSIPVIQVIDETQEEPILIDSDSMTGLTSSAAKQAITDKLETLGKGKMVLQYRLRDWGISRQRYWGVPIPMVHCPTCGVVPEKEENLPVSLPDIDYVYGESTLAQQPDFYQTQCPQCQGPAKRETDTFDTFFDSSWYYHYFITQSQTSMIGHDNDQWMPVDMYIGGIEHAILHLLYARYIQKVLVCLGLSNHKEPFKQLLSQGMVLKDGAKMSKSKGNVVDPSDLIDRYGADTLRLFIIFAAPPEQNLEWSDGGVEGAHRFLKRIWHFAHTHQELIAQADNMEITPESPHIEVLAEVHTLLATIARDINKQQLNTVASGAMKLFQVLQKIPADHQHSALLRYVFMTLLQVINPVTPHISHTLWQELALSATPIEKSAWPEPRDDIIAACRTIQLTVQINGKTKGQISVDGSQDEASILGLLTSHDKYGSFFQNKTVKKTILVPNKLISIVLA